MKEKIMKKKQYPYPYHFDPRVHNIIIWKMAKKVNSLTLFTRVKKKRGLLRGICELFSIGR